MHRGGRQAAEGRHRHGAGLRRGTKRNPTYEEVCTGRTGHAEVLRVGYDPKALHLETLLKVFMEMHDPTSKDRQGPDMGSQYRSIILYNSDAQKEAVNAFLKEAQKGYDRPIATEVRKLDVFWPAEEYHRDYYKRNPFQPYCMLEIGPKVAKVKREFASLMKKG